MISIWGLSCAMTNKSRCVLCATSSIQCLKCENQSLKESLLDSMAMVETLKLKLKRNPLLRCENKFLFFETADTYLPLNLFGDIEDYSFLTITFDPQKFGYINRPDEEQKYILHTLWQLIDKSLVRQLTGCFEYQKNGTTHAHILLKRSGITTDADITSYLVPLYTDRDKRQKAILCVPAKFPTVEDYIRKESKEYYRYQNPIDADQLLEPQVKPYLSQKLVNGRSYDDVLQEYIKEQVKSLDLFKKRLSSKYDT